MQSSQHTTPSNKIVPQKRWYNKKEVCAAAQISLSTLVRAELAGTCPPGRRFGARCCRYDARQVEEWLATGSWSPLPWQQQQEVSHD